MRILTRVAACGVFACLIAATSASADNVLLKIPFGFNPKLPNVNAAAMVLSESLPAGREDLKVKIYAPGKLVPPFEILDAVSTGKVNAGYASPAYWAGKMPAASIFSSVPFGPGIGELLAWYKQGNGAALHQEMYDSAGYNVHPLACGIMVPSSAGWYQREINTLEDFQGLKMRTIGLGAEVLKKVGVSTSTIPVAEVYPSLEKGAIDAAEIGGPAIDSIIGLHKVAKYNYYPGWQKQAFFFELLINKDVWNGMSDGQHAAIQSACDQAIANTVAEGSGAQFGPMTAYVEDGVEVRRFSNDVLTGLRTAWDEVAAGMSAEDAMFQKVYDDLSAFRANYEIWDVSSNLPRK